MPKSSKRTKNGGQAPLVFDRSNYTWMGVSVALIVVGFTAMYLDGQFLGFVSLTVSPILIVLGYAVLIYAILHRSGDEASPPESA
jgi:hypothetical protein